MRLFRRQSGITQRELADKAGLSTAAVRDLEQGRTKSPKPDSIDALAAVLTLNRHDTGELHAAARTHRSPATTPTGALRINVLGPLEVRYGDTPIAVNSAPQRTLLVRLALAAGTTVSQDELIDLLWPRDAPANAATLLQTRIARLRRLLESGRSSRATSPSANRSRSSDLSIVGNQAGYRLEATAETLDLLAFRELVAKATNPRLAPAAELRRPPAGRADLPHRTSAAASRSPLDESARDLATDEPPAEPSARDESARHLVADTTPAEPSPHNDPASHLAADEAPTERSPHDEPARHLATDEARANAAAAIDALPGALSGGVSNLVCPSAISAPDASDLEHGSALSEQTALADLAEALDLWRGEPDIETSHPLSLAIANEYAEAVHAFAALAREVGVPEQALKTLRGLTSRHELDEPLHAELIHTLAAAGRQAEALSAYDRIRTALAVQLGIDPGEHLRAAHLAVLRQQSSTRQVVAQQAPSAPPDFVGRVAELSTICNALARPDALSSRVVLVNGIAGVGKTALALTAAHQLREEYPDGQLYADLRGNDTVSPAPLQVLGRFLRALGVSSRRIGTDEAEAAALFRTELAGRRILVLLDNAQDAAQVRPLLPGSGRSDVIVTSRRRLPELDTAEVVNLEPLPRDDAVRLITSTARMAGTATDEEVAALAEACARLPLALRIAGARLATRREWTVADLARRLDDSNRRLSELSLGESSVLNSFQLSYADLTPVAQRAFRLCSLHPGDDFSAEGTGILLGVPAPDAERILEDLLEANMLMQHTTNRYRFHDLLGLYAGRLLAEDPEADLARDRLHAWYLESVTAAIHLTYPQLVRLGGHPAPDRLFPSEAAALDWLDDELRGLLAVVQITADSGDHQLAWQITDQLRGYYWMRRGADGWLPAAQAGLAAATAAGNDRARVAMLMNRGQALWAAGHDDDSMADCLAGHALAVAVGWNTAAGYMAHQIGWLHLERGTLDEAALWMSRALDWTEGEPHSHVRAIALNGLGMTRLYQGRLRESADLLSTALEKYENALTTSVLTISGNLASALRQLGEVDGAAELLDEVLNAYRRRSHPRGELSTMDELARLHLQRGNGATALDLAQRAHDLATALQDRKAQAQTGATVAQAHLALGDIAAAIKQSEECLAIARDLYPYIETEALLTLAKALHLTGDLHTATELNAEAKAIATTRGFHLLATQATHIHH
nr:BTAD domain-containing putative transcriptional regulator [Kribbella italica]